MPIAMTFDDGPNAKSTLDLLALLDKMHIPATFFVLGAMVKKYPGSLKQIANSPCRHQIGNHSWTHSRFNQLSNDALQDEILRTQQEIENTLGASMPHLMRPPYGAVTADQRKFITGLGYKLVFWDLDSNDWNRRIHKNASDIATYISNNLHDGNVVLAHDIHERTIEAMKILLPSLKDKGYSFTTISALTTTTAGILSASPPPAVH